jgi:peptidyl-prolyl cis-trans isomerase C/foldase protein PrsA
VGSAVAVVNGAIFTRGDVLAEARPGLQAIEENKDLTDAGRAAQTRDLLNITLKSMVERELVLQEARRVIPEEETQVLEADVDSIVKRAIREIGTLTRLEWMLQSEGRTIEKEKKTALESRMIQTLLQREVDARVMVSPAEMQRYYDEHRAKFDEEKQVRVRQIFLSSRNYASVEKALEKAGDLRRQIEEGADFAKLAQQYSDGPYAKDGGLWQFVKRGTGHFRPGVEEAAFKLEIKQVSPPIGTEIGAHLIKIEDVKPARRVPFTEAQNAIVVVLREQKRERLYQDFIRRLIDKAYVQVRWE